MTKDSYTELKYRQQGGIASVENSSKLYLKEKTQVLAGNHSPWFEFRDKTKQSFQLLLDTVLRLFEIS